MPYIQKNYNVYTDAQHNSVAGSSMGGLEAFWIGMEHPEKFGTVGVFSPSLWAFDEADWKAYFGSKTFGDTSSFMYFYCGSFGGDTGYCTEPVYNSLIDAGYPKEKLVYSKYEPGKHEVEYWNNIYPEFLEAMFNQKVSGLEYSVPVKYEDRTPPENAEMIASYAEESETGPDTRPDHIKNYVFFDNSEMKWDKVYAYWWPSNNEPPANKITGEPYGKLWPGLEMEKIEGTEIYRIVAPVNVSNIIFSMGVLDDDVKKGVKAYQTDNLLYSDAACSGKVYKIDTSVEPIKGTGIEKTKFKYPSGTWTDYKD